MPGDVEVADHDVVAFLRGGQVSPPVVDHQAHVGPLEKASVPRAELRGGEARHLGHQLDHRRLGHAEGGARARRDAGRHADERGPSRRGVQEQRQEPLPALVPGGRAAAEDVEVVEPKLAVIAGVDDGDDARRAFRAPAQRLGRREMCERRAQRIEEHDRKERGVGEGAPAALGWPDDIGQHDVGRGREQHAGAKANRGQDEVARRDRAGDGPDRVRRGELAERPRRTAAPAEGCPQGGEHGTGSDRARPRGCRREADDAHEVLPEARLHADVPEVAGEVDEAPKPADRCPRGTQKRESGEHGRRHMPEHDRGEPGPQGEGDEEHEAHRGEGVDRVVKHLREEPHPKNLEPEAERPGCGRHQAQAAGRKPGRGHPRRLGSRQGRAAHEEREEPGHGARGGGGEVARRHTDEGRQAEPHGGDPDRAACDVDGVEQTAPASDVARRGERLTEGRQRCPEADGGRQQRHDDRQRPSGPIRGEGVLHAEHEHRPERAGRHPELEKRIAPDGACRGRSSQRRPEAETREVAGEHGRGRDGGRTQDEPRRPHPQELEAECGRAREAEAQPEDPAHVADRGLAIHWPITVAEVTAASARLATATSAGPRGRSKR